MVKKRRERVEHHKQSLGDQLENPETYGVRVRSGSLALAGISVMPFQHAIR